MFLTGYLRPRIDAEVSNKEPSDLEGPLTRPLVVVRDDSGSKGDLVTYDRSIGVSVLAGTRQNDKPANDLARRVFAILTDFSICIATGSPIAAVIDDGCNGPYSVTESHNYARRYMTVEFTAVGQIGE